MTADTQAAMVQAVLIGLGSNYHAQKAFALAFFEFEKLGLLSSSQVVYGKDTEARSSLMYHNVCVYLQLDKKTSYADLQKIFKQIERQCGRDERKKTAEFDYQVALDIDILAVCIDDKWQLNHQRLPFKKHELFGIRQLAAFLLPMP